MTSAASQHHPFTAEDGDRPTQPLVRSHDASRVLPLVGRICLSIIFLVSAPKHFEPGTIAAAAAHGVPLADVLVPLSGVLAAAGGVSVLFGYKAKTGALLLVLFLVPVTIFMHPFWSAPEQLPNFLKNLGLLGAALFVGHFGAGPLSADARIARMHVRILQELET